MTQNYEEIVEFVYEYHDMMVDKTPSLYDTNDLDSLRTVFMGSILEHIVKMMYLDPERSVKDVTDEIIKNEELMQDCYSDAVELTKFGSYC